MVAASFALVCFPSTYILILLLLHLQHQRVTVLQCAGPVIVAAVCLSSSAAAFTARCCRGRGRCRGEFLVGDPDVLPEAVLVLEVLRAVLAHLRLLRRVLCPDVAPQVHRGNDQLAEAALGPLGVGSVGCRAGESSQLGEGNKLEPRFPMFYCIRSHN